MPELTLKIAHPVTGEETEVTVSFEITPADRDVGIMTWGIEELEIKDPSELNDKMSQSDWNRIEEQIYTAYDPEDFEYEGDDCED